ncbi:MAG: hypothetical protein HYV34_03755 [Candidatus Kerfeldbacteria bacterium]|nr:hypothetical protein [Candidatus Kerfeldbacteria bacterium]
MIFRSTLRESLAIAWKHKFLWFFGLFAALMGAGGELDILFSYNDTITGNESAFLAMKYLFEDGSFSWANVADMFQKNSAAAVGIMLLLLVLFVFLLWLISVSQGALLYSASQITKKQSVSFDRAARTGHDHVKSLLGLNILYKGVIFGLLIALAIPLLLAVNAGENSVANTLITLTAFFVLVPFNIVAGFVTRYAAAYVVINGTTVKEGLRSGWRLFLANWLVSIEMSVILMVVNVVAGLGVMVGAGILILPYLVLWFIFSLVNLGIIVNIILVLALITVLAFALAGAGFISSFQWNAWTLLFLRMIKGKAESKLHRIADSLARAPVQNAGSSK